MSLVSQFDLSLQFVLGTDTFHLGYTETGHCVGEPNTTLTPPQRLQWDIPEQVCRLGMGGLDLTLRMKEPEFLRVPRGPQEERRPQGVCLEKY